MSKKWISMFLAVMMLLGLAVPAFAEGEPEAPPPAEIVDEAPPALDEAAPIEDVTAEDAIVEETVTEEIPAEEENTDYGIMTVSAAPVSVGSVTANLTGNVGKIENITYLSTDNSLCYTVDKTGISYNTKEGPVWVTESTGIPTQFTVAPGTKLAVYTNTENDISVENGSVLENVFHSFPSGSGELISFRRVSVQTPASGAITITVTGSNTPTPAQIPFTFYNNDPDSGVIVGGGNTTVEGQYAWALGDTVISGGSFEVWTGPGYEIQVLSGGSIESVQPPSGEGAAYVPGGSTCYVLHVDEDATEFVIAAVKQGEHFQAPDTNAPQAETPPQSDGTFSDVTSGVWYEDTVMSAYEKGIVKGVTENTFSPNSTTTRGQTVTMLYRAMGSPGGANVFSDTSGEVGSAAGWASASGVTNGVSTTAFAPNSSITREQLVTMLYRMAGSPAVSSTDDIYMYTDGSLVQSYARNAVAWALSNGLLNGYGDGTIRPAGVATRAEVCTIIMRYLG